MLTSAARRRPEARVPRPRGAPPRWSLRYLPEIDGLRGVAIALVIVYHLWFRRVSGGVDVFLFLSGFLITGSLLRAVEQHGRIRFASFYARIVRRIFPPALTVLLGVAVATLVWLPQTRWRDTLADITASALYVVNWHLAGNSVDYLATRDSASPVQHYWSLAIQGQFYLIWPLLMTAAALLATRLAARPRAAIAVLVGAVFVLSLGYSVYRTPLLQAFTYFDTFARLWEFALGGLLLLTLPYLRLPRAAAAALGWSGLAALVICGAVFSGGDEFPGWAALWPTLAAALIIAAAAGTDGAAASGAGGVPGISRLLRSWPLARLGNLSYALYLWHWPVLICYLSVTDRIAASLRGGLLVVAISVALAVVTRWLVELRLPRTGLGQRSNSGGFALAAAGVAAVLVTTGAWHGYLSARQPPPHDPRSYPGAAHLAEPRDLPDVPYLPESWNAKQDRAVIYDADHEGCHQDMRGSKVLWCAFGRADADRTIALVGGSHSAHWLPALLELTEPYRWRIVSITKASCRFQPLSHRDRDNRIGQSCAEWNEGVIAELERLRPDAVMTTSTTGQGGRDYTPEGYITQWRRLDGLGITVLAVRDTPWHTSGVPDCVERRGPAAPGCVLDRREHGLVGPAVVERRTDVPGNVRFLDMTDYVCAPERCAPVVGNILVYSDAHHLTATYARTMAPYLADEIVAATGWPTGG